MTIRSISYNREFNPLTIPSPLAFTGKKIGFNPLRVPTPLANNATRYTGDDTVTFKLKPLQADRFDKINYMS